MKKTTVKKMLICASMLLCFLGGVLVSFNASLDTSPLEPESKPQNQQEDDVTENVAEIFQDLDLEEMRQRIQEIQEALNEGVQIPPQGNIILEGSHTARHIERLVEESIFAPTPDGLVPTPEVAIQIAEAIWLPIYGERIYNQQPFIAQYYPRLDVWFVRGTLPSALHRGGTANIVIRKSDGQILSVTHTR